MLVDVRVRPIGYALVLICTCGAQAFGQMSRSLDVLDLHDVLSPAMLATKLDTARVVFVGETHTRYADHLNQLALIQQLRQRHPNLAIGVEYFPESVQEQLDAYLAGQTTEQTFLRETDYFRHWGYDYRLYEPIFQYARAQHIPVRALNVPESLPAAVARVGLAGLSKDQRAELPMDMVPASADYRARLRDAFLEHQDSSVTFDHFVEAQLAWDESMAKSAAAYLEANPNRRMVVLAGSGHLEFGSGIPQRLERRIHVSYAIVLNSDNGIEPGMADYVLVSKDQDLPAAGVLGVDLAEKSGQCRVRSVTPGGAAQRAGLRAGDVLASIDGQPIKTVADVHLALWNKKPSDRVQVDVRHRRWFHWSEHTFEISLAAAPKTPPDRSE
jgi:uncharacterized iron-regulated protein